MKKTPTKDSKEIALLRKQRMEAIAACDFTQAKMMDSQIQILLANQLTNDYDASLTKAKIQYNIVKEEIRIKASDEYSKSYEEVFRIQRNYQERKTALQSIHAESLSRQAEKYAQELELEANRTVIEADTLRREAQIRAKNGEYEEAEKILKLSDEIRANVTRQRQEEVNAKYERLLAEAEQKHNEDNAAWDAKLRVALNEIKQKYDATIQSLKNTLASASIRLKVERDLNEEEQFFMDLEFDDQNTPIKVIPGSPKTPKSPRTPKSTRTPKSNLSKTTPTRTPSSGKKTPKSAKKTPISSKSTGVVSPK